MPTIRDIQQILPPGIGWEVIPDEDTPLLEVDGGLVFVWIEDDRFVVDAGVDASDPAAGLLNVMEPSTWASLGCANPAYVGTNAADVLRAILDIAASLEEANGSTW